MKHLYLALLLVLFAFPLAAQNAADSTPKESEQQQDVVPVPAQAPIKAEPPRVRIMPFLPYTGTLDLERTTKKQRGKAVTTAPNKAEARPYSNSSVQQERSFAIVFKEGSTDLTPPAVERIKQSAQRIKQLSSSTFTLITYYQEGDTASRTQATRRLEVVNNTLFDLGIKKTIQTYAYPRKQLVINKDTVIIIVK